MNIIILYYCHFLYVFTLYCQFLYKIISSYMQFISQYMYFPYIIIIITIIEMNECIFCVSSHSYVCAVNKIVVVKKSCNVMYWLSVIMYQFLFVYNSLRWVCLCILFAISKRPLHLNSFQQSKQLKDVVSDHDLTFYRIYALEIFFVVIGMNWVQNIMMRVWDDFLRNMANTSQ